MERPSEDPSFVDLAMDDLGGRRITSLLDRLDCVVPWEQLAAPIRGLYRNDTRKGGRPNIPVVIMLRCLFLSKWFGLSDPQMEDQVNDRISFRRFVGLRGQQRAPDETTMVEFRDRLRSAGLFQHLFEIAKSALDRQGLIVREGTIVDATIIEQARPRPRKNKDGEKTAYDPDASYTKKAGQIRHGYKMHTAVDVHSGLITNLTFTTAKTHDSTQIDELTREEEVAVLADSAYADRQRRAELQADGVMDGIAYKRVRGEEELPKWKQRFNRVVARLRGPGEMPFAWIKRLQGFVRVRYRGLQRNREDAYCHAMAFNFRRSLPLLK